MYARVLLPLPFLPNPTETLQNIKHIIFHQTYHRNLNKCQMSKSGTLYILEYICTGTIFCPYELDQLCVFGAIYSTSILQTYLYTNFPSMGS